MTESKRVTIRDIAKACNVSAPTVSRVLNNNYDGFSLQQEKIDLIHKTCREMGYQPNRFARTLRSQRSGFIGLSLSYKPAHKGMERGDILNPLISGIGKLVAGASSFLDEKQYNLVFLPRNEDQDGPFSEEQIFPHIVDGLIYMNPTDSHVEFIEIAKRRHYMVLIGGLRDMEGITTVDVNNQAEMYKLTSHMIDVGSRNILFLAFASGHYRIVEQRRLGYVRALQDHGLVVDEDLIVQRGAKEDEVEKLVYDLLQNRSDIDGIVIAVGSFYLNGIMSVLQHTGRKIPDDMRLAVFHGEPEFNFFWPGVTHIRIEQYHLAAVAAEHLYNAIQSGERDLKSLLISCELVIGRSTSGCDSESLYLPQNL